MDERRSSPVELLWESRGRVRAHAGDDRARSPGSPARAWSGWRRYGPARLALCGGVALYLVGLAAFRLRLLGGVSWIKLAAAAVLLAVGWLGTGLNGLTLAAIVTAVLGALTAAYAAGWVG